MNADETYKGTPVKGCYRWSGDEPHFAHNWKEISTLKTFRCPGMADITVTQRGQHVAPKVPKRSARAATTEAGRPKGAEVSPAGAVIGYGILLGVSVPFIGILWAWAASVVRSFGGLF